MSDLVRSCLVDTNVLIRFANPADPRHDISRRAIATARQAHELRVASQNLIEAWNVMTRPLERNGFGHSITQADRQLHLIERLFPRLPDPPDLYPRWRNLVVSFEVSGVQVHDARIVAVMLTNAVESILTFNSQDFQRYEKLGIRILDPTRLDA